MKLRQPNRVRIAAGILVPLLAALIGCGGSSNAGDPSPSGANATFSALRLSAVGDAIDGVSEARAVLLDGRVVVTGGDRAVGGVATVQIYDPAQRRFSAAGALLERRFVHSATLTRAGRLIVAGGFNDSGRFLSSAEEVDSVAGTSRALPPLCAPRDNQHAVALDGERILFIGGDSDEAGYISRVEIYYPDSGPDRCDRNLEVGRVHEAVADPGDGYVYVFGGLAVAPDSSVVYLRSIEKIDKDSGAISPAGEMLTARKQFEATVLYDGRILITGGYFEDQAQDVAEVYDPRRGTSIAVGSMATPRAGHSATRLRDGRVLVAGGMRGSSAVATTEVYDPFTRSFDNGPDMLQPRALHVAAALEDGSVLLIGGYQGQGTYTRASELVEVGP